MTVKTRFKDAPWAKDSHRVTIGGAGGIGSWLAFLLARTEQNIDLWDFDTIDESNMSGQLYMISHIGMPKVIACQELVRNSSGYEFEFNPFNSKLTVGSKLHPICFSAFDNMEARKDMFANWEKYHMNKDGAIFIDGRMLMESGHIFCVTKETAERYKSEYLFDDAEVPAIDCATKATSHCGAYISSMMVSMFTNHLTNLHYKEDIRTVPFRYEFELPLTNFNSFD